MVDIYGHKERYLRWKEEVIEDKVGIKGISKNNSDILIKFVFDMEIGHNISKSSKGGARSYPRLNNLRQRLAQIFGWLEDKGVEDIAKKNKKFFKELEKKVMILFNDMNNGNLKTLKGNEYKSTNDYIRVFKTFWNWYIKVNRKLGVIIPDINEDLRIEKPNPRFVYLTKPEFDKFRKHFDTKEKQLILLFCLDSIIRSPGELFSVEARDIYKEGKEIMLNIRNEIAKNNFGRGFNLVYCGEEILKHIQKKKLKDSDKLFEINIRTLHKEMQNIAVKLFGDKETRGGKKYGEITLYDLRHCGAIHFRGALQKNGGSLDSLRQRGGWKNFDMVNYYTQFLNLTGNLPKQKILVPEDKPEIEKEVENLKKNVVHLKEWLLEELTGKPLTPKMKRELREPIDKENLPPLLRNFA